jgi:DNA/RNA endonuclease YhcR with UshA esterase domain
VKESSLNRFCLIGAIIGILLLYAYSFFGVQDEIGIGEIDSGMVGSVVNVSGRAEGVYFHKDGHVFFTLDDGTGEIKVVLWKDVAMQLELTGSRRIRNNKTLNIEGRIEKYKGELELIPSAKGVKFI